MQSFCLRECGAPCTTFIPAALSVPFLSEATSDAPQAKARIRWTGTLGDTVWRCAARPLTTPIDGVRTVHAGPRRFRRIPCSDVTGALRVIRDPCLLGAVRFCSTPYASRHATIFYGTDRIRQRLYYRTSVSVRQCDECICLFADGSIPTELGESLSPNSTSCQFADCTYGRDENGLVEEAIIRHRGQRVTPEKDTRKIRSSLRADATSLSARISESFKLLRRMAEPDVQVAFAMHFENAEQSAEQFGVICRFLDDIKMGWMAVTLLFLQTTIGRCV